MSVSRLETAASMALAVAALVLAGSFAHREFSEGTVPQGGQPPVMSLVYEPQWQELLKAGVQRGEPSATIQLIEFADFECPFCRKFSTVADAIETKYEGRIRRTFIHLPLSNHRFAYPAARVAECAREQGQFWKTHDALFAKQDSLGVKSWTSYARDGEVSDLLRFDRCAADTTKVANLERDLRIREDFRVTMTPTVIVNGWRFTLPPSDSVLARTIDQILGGQKPSLRNDE